MNKEQLLAAIRKLSRASVKHYQIANGDRKGDPTAAANAEFTAACNLITGLGFDVKDDEIYEALGW